MVRHIVDAKTKPPVAIYSSYRDDNNVLGLAGVASAAPDIAPRFSSWYPLLAYSPEYVAMRAAKKIGADVEFIDLPFHATLKPLPKRDDERESGGPGTPDPTPQRDDDHLLAESGFYQHVARVAGYRTWDEAWRIATDRYGDVPTACVSCFQQCYAEPSLMQAHPLAYLRERLHGNDVGVYAPG